MGRVPYPEPRMSPSQARLPSPSARFLVESLILGLIVGVALILIDAPLWSFCIGSLAALPLLLRELRTIDSDREEQGRGWKTQSSRWPPGQNPFRASPFAQSRERAQSFWLVGVGALFGGLLFGMAAILIAMLLFGVLSDSRVLMLILPGLVSLFLIILGARSLVKASYWEDFVAHRRLRAARRDARNADFPPCPDEDEIHRYETEAAGRQHSARRDEQKADDE